MPNFLNTTSDELAFLSTNPPSLYIHFTDLSQRKHCSSQTTMQNKMSEGHTALLQRTHKTSDAPHLFYTSPCLQTYSQLLSLDTPIL